MDYLRIYGLPIPRVYKWDAPALYPVRLAYMIMGKVQERAIYDMCYTISTKEGRVFVERVIRMEKKLFDIEFPISGSLYYKHSLSSGVQSVPLSLSLTIPQAD